MTSTLTLVRERKIGELLPPKGSGKRWEASGVLARDGHYYVVFDDRTEIARLSSCLEPNEANGVFGIAHAVCGYEGITYNPDRDRYYLLVESHEHGDGHYRAV